MLNKIMMSGRLLTETAVTAKDDLRYCKFSIAVEQPKQKGGDAVETDTFTCLAFNDNASAVSLLYSKGGTITFVGSLRNQCYHDHSCQCLSNLILSLHQYHRLLF